MKNRSFILGLSLFVQISQAGIIDQFHGKTFLVTASHRSCALHVEKLTDDTVVTSNVIAEETYRYYNGQTENYNNCSGTTKVRTCDSNGGCFIDKDTSPSLYLLPDGNIISFRTDGTFLKMYPSAFESYYIAN